MITVSNTRREIRKAVPTVVSPVQTLIVVWYPTEFHPQEHPNRKIGLVFSAAVWL